MFLHIHKHPPIQRFLRREDGSISVEFAILFPGILLVCLSMAAIAMYFATLSDVQHLASDMTRLSLTYVDRAFPIDQICLSLQSDVLPKLVEGLPFVTAERVSDVICHSQDAGRSIMVAITYDLSETLAHRLGTLIGFSVTEMSGSAEMLL
ncbi:TadE/TadG family type IV pilus assembly protein [Oceaniglobus ichthyenteri]|uniref:TadE/TadG family type IV pilus assembly protein n=1 Tax=Oceaniglobus ichthyenteri TaxID=2136177 RepID=UPI000D39E89D|nr:TadE/TadG family type IV pilus assembly protein [Oceaniglobus ichthyenteri]